ncbi:hypothetical protein QF035_000300 [Streptomyces umbrinus]|uniref:Uncharacterized protein n=1 Tax=Streptomyces umbrinus TaxID=67370 RepID=A0ABU0SGU5_9ACTN|nr:hypothetical protein [Streptomyces umbrinus]
MLPRSGGRTPGCCRAAGPRGHGLDCLGTAVRHEPLPDEQEAIRDAAGIIAEYNARLEEQARAYEEGHH